MEGGKREQVVRSADGTEVLVRFGVWRCLICGETIFSIDAPTHCPFCGSHAEHITADLGAYDPARINDVSGALSADDRAHLEASLRGEAVDGAFYAAMAKHGSAPDSLRSAMKRVSRMEAEHLGIFAKLLGGAKKPEADATPSGDWAADVRASMAREMGASDEYARWAAATANPRLRQVWSALAAVERDHLTFETAMLK